MSERRTYLTRRPDRLAGGGPSSYADMPRLAIRRQGDLSMPLRRELLNAVVRITSAGHLMGTGMVLSVDSEKGRRFHYAVTADHVTRNQPELAAEIPDPSASNPPRLYVPLGIEDWIQPIEGLDLSLSLLPATHPEGPFSALPLEEAYAVGREPLLGAEVYYVGIFAPLGIPMARSGALGAKNVTVGKPKQGYCYTANLVDCRSYGGFSGSPCFVQTVYASDTPIKKPPSDVQMQAMAREDGTIPRLTELIYAPYFFGIFTAHYTDDMEEEEDGVVSRLGVGVMVRHHEIWEALMSDEVKGQREGIDAAIDRLEAERGQQLRDVAASPNSEFDRFEQLARRLVNTPKPARD
jgi:hypothetical protein